MSDKNIWIAAGEGDLERVRYLVEHEGLSPTVPDPFTYTPIHAAASYGQQDILRYLLTHPTCPADGANVLDDDGESPLFVVELAPVAELLIELGADPEHKNLEGQTALDSALENGHQAVAEVLARKLGVPVPQPPTDEEEEQGQRLERDLAATHDDSNAADAPTANGSVNGSANGTASHDNTGRRSEGLFAAAQNILQGADQRFRAAHPDAPADAQTELTPEEEERLKDLVGASVVSQILDGWTRGSNA